MGGFDWLAATLVYGTLDIDVLRFVDGAHQIKGASCSTLLPGKFSKRKVSSAPDVLPSLWREHGSLSLVLRTQNKFIESVDGLPLALLGLEI